MDNTKKERIISICTGYGGLELGLEQAGVPVDPICYVEIEAFACQNLVQKVESGQMAPAPIWTDLATFNFQPFCGKVDGIVGGYPCQPFSKAGLRKGSSDNRNLWPFIANGINIVQPAWVFFENVIGHLSLGLDRVLFDLGRLGYRAEAGIFSAAEIGAPHNRERVFVLAYYTGWRRESKSASEPTYAESSALGNATVKRLQGWVESEYNIAGSGPFGLPATTGTQWPAGRNQSQLYWEAPRTYQP